MYTKYVESSLKEEDAVYSEDVQAAAGRTSIVGL